MKDKPNKQALHLSSESIVRHMVLPKYIIGMLFVFTCF